MYPFERFGNDAKTTLQFVQEEAERIELPDALSESNFEWAAKGQKQIEALVAKLGRAEAIWFRPLGS